MNHLPTAPGGTTEPVLQEVVRALARCVEGAGAVSFVLFGSRATGASHERSDWDIGVLREHPLTPAERARMHAVLEDWPTLHALQLVDLSAVSEAFRRNALAQAITLAKIAA